MAKPSFIELPGAEPIPILYEDRSVLAIDKPCGWLLVPVAWQRTSRNLQAALISSIRAGDFWARSRSLRYLRFIHRLDADTSGALLLAKSPGALSALGKLFERRQVQKVYWAVVHGCPARREWICRQKLAPVEGQPERIRIDPRHGVAAETRFRVLHIAGETALLEARPLTGRTHQIRVHLAASGHPVVGDALYGQAKPGARPLGLRSVGLAYQDPFTRRRVEIRAPGDQFLREFGTALGASPKGTSPRGHRSSSAPAR